MRLRHRVQLLLVLVLALVVVDAFVAGMAITARNRANDTLNDQLQPAAMAVRSLSEALVDQETGQRGYVITGDESFLAPYRSGRAQEELALATLRSMLEDYPVLLADVEAVASAAEEWRRQAAEPEIEAVRRGRRDLASALVASGEGRFQFDDVRDAVEQLRTSELAERDTTRQQADRARRWVSEVMLLNIVSLGGLTIAMVVLLRRWVTGPLAHISEAVREVAGGSLRRSIPTPGPPELAGLGADVDAMRQRILAEVDATARAKEALAQSGLVALTLRSQLEPDNLPLPDGLAMAARFRPAEGVLAGDWYDVVAAPTGRLGLVVVDVAGHGAEAGIFALRAKQLLVAAVRQEMGPGEALKWVSEQFGDTEEMFLTCLVVDLDPATGAACYANAGHPPGLVRRSSDRRLDALNTTGPLLGPLPGRWATHELTLAAGDLLVAFTDGITEARNPRGEQFGLKRLSEVVVGQPGAADVEDIATACMEAVVDFTERRLADDLTVVVLSRTGVTAAVPAAPASSTSAAHE